MNEKQQLDVYIEGIQRYFDHMDVVSKDLTVDAPYLSKSEDQLAFNYTGIIAVSGSKRGHVFFTASMGMLRDILHKHQETDFSESAMRDIAGEVTNTIAGNARAKFGSDFHISVPQIVNTRDKIADISKLSRSFVIPMRWNNNRAQLVVSM